MRRTINFSQFTGSGADNAGPDYSFRPLLPREPESNPNPPFVIGKPPRGPSHMHDAPGFDGRCGLCLELRRLARERGR